MCFKMSDKTIDINVHAPENWKLFRKLQSSEILESRKLAILHNFVGQTIT